MLFIRLQCVVALLIAAASSVACADILISTSADVPVFVFAGQSNAFGSNNFNELTTAQQAAQPKVLFYGPNEYGGTWGPLIPSLSSPNRNGSFGPEISTGKTISAAFGGAQVAQVKLALGGSSLYDQWDPVNPGPNYYDYLITRVQVSMEDLQQKHGLTGHVAGFFWMQGESDVGRSDYATKLTEFIAALRSNPVINNPQLPFVFGQIIDFDPPASTDFRALQQVVADTVPNTAFVRTDDLRPLNSYVHFSGQGIYTLGERFGAGYLSLVPEPSSFTLLALGLLFVCRFRP